MTLPVIQLHNVMCAFLLLIFYEHSLFSDNFRFFMRKVRYLVPDYRHIHFRPHIFSLCLSQSRNLPPLSSPQSSVLPPLSSPQSSVLLRLSSLLPLSSPRRARFNMRTNSPGGGHGIVRGRNPHLFSSESINFPCPISSEANERRKKERTKKTDQQTTTRCTRRRILCTAGQALSCGPLWEEVPLLPNQLRKTKTFQSSVELIKFLLKNKKSWQNSNLERNGKEFQKSRSRSVEKKYQKTRNDFNVFRKKKFVSRQKISSNKRKNLSQPKEVRHPLLKRLIGLTWLEQARFEKHENTGFFPLRNSTWKRPKLSGHCRPTASVFRRNFIFCLILKGSSSETFLFWTKKNW